VLASGLVLYSTARAGSGFALIGSAEAIMGAGIGLAMTPATDSIMGTLPPERASVGSAMNDTVRQVGGALGVAILGSVLSSHYRGGMDGAVHGLPAGARDAASDSITGATAVAERVGGAAGHTLQQAANGAFVDGMQIAMLVAAGVTLVGALVALVLLPARAEQTEAAHAPAPARLTVAEPVAA
jgi:MFS transporter, DHA2 family, multidrug resistance protein